MASARSPPPKAWEPTRPSTPKRLANDWSSVRTPPSVASLARAELATGSAMHSIALSGGASRARTPPRGVKRTPEHSALRTLQLEQGYDQTLNSKPGIPAYKPDEAFHRTLTYKQSPYGKMTQLAAKRELAKLAARPTPKRHAKRKDLDAHGFPMSLEQRALDARTEALEAYDQAARSATRREAALDSMLNALPGLSEVVIESTDGSIEELKRRLEERGVDYQGCVHKADLITLLQRTQLEDSQRLLQKQQQARQLIDELRERTLEAVEAIVEWRQKVAALDDVQNVQTAPPPFLWC
jgi:hypothetical protein